MMSMRGRWKGPLKVLPLQAGIVPAEIAVPVAELGVGEVLLAVVHGPLKPGEVLLIPGVPEDHQAGDHGLVVGPPQLHVVLVGLGGTAQAVNKVEQAAVLIVPAGVDGLVKDLHGDLVLLLVPLPVGVLHEEPGALDVVAGVDHPALGHIQAGGAVQVHALQGAAQLGLVVVLEDLIHALLGPLIVEGLLLRVHPAQHGGDVQVDHGVGQSPAGPGLRNGLGTHAGGVVDQALVQVPDQVIGPAGPLQALLLPGHAVVLRVGDGIKTLGEAVAALAQGLAVAGDGEVHAAARLAVDAVLLHEVQAALAGLQPLLLHPVHMAQVGEGPGAPALHPHALIGGEHLSLPVQAGVYAAVHRVHSILQPEADAPLQFLLDPLLMALQPDRQIHIHSTFPNLGGNAPPAASIIPVRFLPVNR